MSGNLAASLCVIVDAPQVVTIRHRREGAVQRKNLQLVSRQIELANNLGPKEGYDVGTNRELETGKNFLCYRGAAQHVASLEHQHTFTCACKISGIHQTVVPATNDDDVVVAHELFGNAVC